MNPEGEFYFAREGNSKSISLIKIHLDRDIHAAQNMVWFFENYVGVGRAKVKRVEMESILKRIISDKQTLSVKHEAHTL